MVKEKSCGGLIVHENKVLFLWSRRFKGYSVPKGHINPGETNLDCALREIGEETGLDVRRVGDFMMEVTYEHPLFHTTKTVVLFLFESKSDRIMPNNAESHEGEYDYVWCGYKKAIEIGKQTNSKEIVLKGIDALKRLGKL